MTSPELSRVSFGPFGSTLKSGIAPHLAASAGPDRAIAPIRAPVTGVYDRHSRSPHSGTAFLWCRDVPLIRPTGLEPAIVTI